MRKLIKGKIYDTMTAKRCGRSEVTARLDLAHLPEELYPADQHYTGETLYRKKNGEYFLHGKGGSATKYAKEIGQNEWTSGDRIMPLTYDEAKTWAENSLDAGDYACLFGQIAEQDGQSMINVRVSNAAAERLRRLSSRTGKTISAMVEDMINKYAIIDNQTI